MFSQRSRALSVLLLLAASALHVTGVPFSSPGGDTLEISGDKLPDAPKNSASTKWESLINLLISEVGSLRDQQFLEEFGEPKGNMTNYKDHRLKLSHIGERDCSSSNFRKENCLLRISSELERNMVCLQFVEREFSKSKKAITDIRFRTKALADHVTELMKNSKRAQELKSETREQLLSALPAASAWERKITVHVLLRDYENFLTHTLRALRHIEQRAMKRAGLKLDN